ncbi:MAG: hypothetical protein DPW18_05260 [Chloroflexi bacterium]|nr:hypothetical protein [Chloroflexota bacterium]MDL1910015.1 hypothetical protein [Chloroflexi bacterium CFX6]
MVNRSLPDGWEWKTLEDVLDSDGVFIDGDWVESKDQDPEGEIRLIQLADVGDGYYRNRSNRFLTHEKALELGCTFLEKGDLLIARMPDPLGRACIFPGDKKQSVTVVDVCIVRTKNAEHRWLMHAINSPQFRADVESLQSGSTRKRISRKNLAKLKLPFPPLPEQERIVSRIEELFSDLEAGVAALERVRAGLRRYKASVLKAAVSGALTPHPSPAGRGDGGEGELPEGWRWVSVGDVAEVKGGKRLPAKHTYSDEPTEYPYIRVTDFENGTINTENLKYLKEETQEQISRYTISTEDVYISIAGTIGVTGVIPEILNGANLTENAAKICNLKDILPKYLHFALASPSGQATIAEKTISTNQPKLALFRIQQIPVPLPPLEEQRRIVAEVERRLSVVREVESAVEAGLARASRLRQAVLRSAFEGKL